MTVDGKNQSMIIADDSFSITNESAIITCARYLPKTAALDDLHSGIQLYITLFGMVFSIICLLLNTIAHLCIPALQTLPGKIVVSLSLSLMLAQVFFLVSNLFSAYKIACKVIAGLQHYFWLCSFFWMNSYATDIALTFMGMKSNLDNKRKHLIVYSLYAWGLPLCVCLSCILLDVFNGDRIFIYGWENNPSTSCWIQPSSALLYSVAVPLAVVIILNSVSLFIILIIFLKIKFQTSSVVEDGGNDAAELGKATLILCCQMSFLMGITWVFGLLANIQELEIFWYVYIVCNSCQGFGILMAFIPKIKRNF